LKVKEEKEQFRTKKRSQEKLFLGRIQHIYHFERDEKLKKKQENEEFIK
jgi:hypothetical protein